MSLKVESIKKLMGWCPNARAPEARRNIDLEYFDSNVPDRARGDNSCLKNSGWLQRESNQILLFAIFLTFVHFLIYNHMGLLPSFFASLPPLFYFVFHWNERIQRFNDIAKKPIVRYVSKLSYLWVLIIIVFIALLMLLTYMIRQSWHSALFGLSILCFFMWGFYFQLIHWEKKNHMRIYIESENGFQKAYAIGEKEGKM
ncbi:hypothetical protein MSBRW_3563 [Methanosarcina barkeri str. Wiesmoor]|uniref:DUF1673 domain-containing protein n=2 Tax=Methanosarcina barkeri TaxID=2208 RepID=A0A0E3LMD2_METBA|nr:DUF1673 domain-containing protein [Methanosarcina barkeri]AKB52816.1 hypothetical protein MSBRW_3563 [Methanosarcina barkeri str. Wiesmoor]